jgi:hypothetical protein
MSTASEGSMSAAAVVVLHSEVDHSTAVVSPTTAGDHRTCCTHANNTINIGLRCTGPERRERSGEAQGRHPRVPSHHAPDFDGEGVHAGNVRRRTPRSSIGKSYSSAMRWCDDSGGERHRHRDGCEFATLGTRP